MDVKKTSSIDSGAPAPIPPYFLEMDADNHDVRVASNTIISRIFEVKARQKSSKPIIVIMGENHSLPITQVLQTSVLQGCLAAGLTPAYGLELRYDYLNHKAVLPTDLQQNDDVKQFLETPLNHRSGLYTDIILSTFQDDTLRMPALLCERHGLSLAFNDAARNIENGKDIINDQDLVNQAAKRKIRFKKSIADLSVEAPRAMFLRNHIMTEFAKAQYRSAQPDILIHMVGDNHVFGSFDDDYLYRHSMTALCRKAGFDVIPVITQMDFDELPDDIDTSNAVIIEGWQEAENCKDFQSTQYKTLIRSLTDSSGLSEVYAASKTDKEPYKERLVRKLLSRIALG